MTLPELTPYIWVAWDLLAVFIIFRCAQVCARKGFIATLMSFLVYIAAVAAAGYVNKYMATYLYDNVVREMVLHTITRNFNLAIPDMGSANLDLLAALPLALKLLMQDNGSIIEDFAAGQTAGSAAISADGAIEGLATQVVDVALKEPLMTVLTAVSFLLVFSLVAFLMRMLTRMFTGVNSIPVIGGVNTVLGCIFGLFEAAIILYVGAFILRLVIMFMGSSFWWLNDKVINDTYIWSIFY